MAVSPTATCRREGCCEPPAGSPGQLDRLDHTGRLQRSAPCRPAVAHAAGAAAAGGGRACHCRLARPAVVSSDARRAGGPSEVLELSGAVVRFGARCFIVLDESSVILLTSPLHSC